MGTIEGMVGPIKNVEDYKESLRDGRVVFYRGKKVDDVTKHPILSLAVKHVGCFFGEGIEDNELRKRLFYYDPELKATVSAFYKEPRSPSDLYDRFQLTYDVTKTAGILAAHISSDAVFSSKIVASELGGEYRERILSYAENATRNNLFLAGAQIDVKGHRRLRPAQQKDADLYVHAVEEKSDGVVVRGAKLHTSNAITCNELFVLPGRAFREGEEDYAIAFAVPANAKGLKLICRPAIGAEAAVNDLEGARASKIAVLESLTIFDNVFVPWERVFVYKDVEKASMLALMFALWHRFTAVSYRVGLADYLIGLAKLVEEANGLEQVPHIQKDIVDIITYAEVQKMCAKMAAYEGIKHEQTGIYIPNPIYTNIGKLYSNANYLNVIHSLIDIAGGLAITAPSGDDYDNEELREDINKYLSAAIPGEERFKLFLILRETVALMGGEESVTHIHAEGSERASLIELYRTYDFDGPKKLIQGLLSKMR
ncbi:4-hydroxybutyryl-CoA dehydratase/vinylacetyl-CoA-Delta-isomerase [subsurface metagenome]